MPSRSARAKRGARAAFDEAFALFDAGEAERAHTAFERCRMSVPEDQVAASSPSPLRGDGTR